MPIRIVGAQLVGLSGPLQLIISREKTKPSAVGVLAFERVKRRGQLNRIVSAPWMTPDQRRHLLKNRVANWPHDVLLPPDALSKILARFMI